MRLAPLYQQDREQAVQQGEQRGEAKLVLRQLQRRFGEIPQNLEETIRQLPVERLEDLGLALLDFDTLTSPQKLKKLMCILVLIPRKFPLS